VQTMGYTTLPETWTMSPEFRDASLNHVFMGDVSAWMYNFLAGINYDADQPGFAHVVIRPYFVKDLQWVKGSYKSVKGLIRSEWKREDGNVKLTVEIPAGTTATVYADKEYRIGSGIHSFVIKKN
uniref:alpha-L-rhamnosidase C-terminal domain-containing protein n=1 Tax=Macellibacteroides fermentans TaxID=879969 RepID=UPI00406D43BD